MTAPGTTGSAFTYQIAASNSPTSYNATGLPPGLSVNTTTGVISGTPTTGGSTSVTISATNVAGTGHATLVITSLSNLALNLTSTASSFQTGSPASSANDGSQTTRWLAANGTFPQWWMVDLGALNSVSRVDISWYSASSRYYQYKIEGSVDNVTYNLLYDNTANVTNGNTSNSFTAANVRYVKVTVTGASSGYASAFEIAVLGLPSLPPPVVNSATTASGTTGTAFSYQITGTNSPTSFGATGLPAGLTVNTTTGVISGTPTTAGTTTAHITAANSSGTSPSVNLTITIAQAPPVITSALTASGNAGTAFSYQITASNTPTSFAATGLPAGLTVNTMTGVISGTPTAGGTSNVVLSAANSGGTGPTATLVLTIVAPDTNIALGKTATASSFQAGNLVANANDGSTTTRWAASDGTVPQWWMVDLGSNKTLSRVDINWFTNATRYSQYIIETSTDNVTYTTVVNKSTNTTDGPTSDTLTGTARYVRVTVSKVSSGFVSAYEIGVYGH